jgi:hypothetical protein
LAGRISFFKAKHGFTGSSGFSHRNARPTDGSGAHSEAKAAAPLPGQEPLF